MALIEANTLSISESEESYVLSLLHDSGCTVSQTSRLAIYDTQHHVKPLLSSCVNGLGCLVAFVHLNNLSIHNG